MRIDPSRKLFVVVVLAALVIAGGFAQRASASHGAPPPPPPPPPLPATFAATFSHSGAVRGATFVETLTLSNTSSNSSSARLGSADVTIPSGFKVAAAQWSWSPWRDRDEGRFGQKDWNASVSSGVLHLRAQSSGGGHADTLRPGQSVTFFLWVVVPCLAPDSTTWSTIAGSSISSPGGDFTPSAPMPTLGPAGACSFDVDVRRSQTVGIPIVGTVRTLDGHGWPTSAFDGIATISGNLSTSPGGTAPVYTTALSIHGGAGGGLATAFAAERDRTLTATSGAITGTSHLFNVGTGVTDHLAFIQQPTDVVDTSAAIAPAVTVGAYDLGGNLKTDATPVTLSIGNDPVGGSTLGGTPTQTSAAGVATFADLTISQIGEGFTLKATSGSLSTTSDPFNVGSGTTVCDGTTDCTASNSDGSTTIDTFGVATLSFGPVGELFPGCSGQDQPVPARGSLVDIIPGGGYTAANPLDLRFTYSRSAVANMDGFLFCISKDNGETYQRVPDCPTVVLNTDNANFLPAFTEQDLPCVGPRTNNTDSGSLSFVLYLTSTDPFGSLS